MLTKNEQNRNLQFRVSIHWFMPSTPATNLNEVKVYVKKLLLVVQFNQCTFVTLKSYVKRSRIDLRQNIQLYIVCKLKCTIQMQHLCPNFRPIPWLLNIRHQLDLNACTRAMSPWKIGWKKKIAEEIAYLVAVLGRRTSPIARNRGGRRKFPVFASFLACLGRKWLRGTPSSFFRKPETFGQRTSRVSGLWLKVSFGSRVQYLCQGSRACTFCSRAGERKIEPLPSSFSFAQFMAIWCRSKHIALLWLRDSLIAVELCFFTLFTGYFKEHVSLTHFSWHAWYPRRAL